MGLIDKWFKPTIITKRERAKSFQQSLKSSSNEEDIQQLIKLNEKFETTEIQDVESIDSSDSANSNIFKDPKVAAYYRKVYEDANYECLHHFDPDFEWTPEEEKNLIWKCDWRVIFWAYIMFTALDFDRSNIAKGLSDNILDDLGLTTNDYNLVRL